MKSTDTTISQAFVAITYEFCTWCEGASLGSEPEISAASWLSKLYSAALELPNIGPENWEDSPDLPTDKVQQATINLGHFNGWYYREYYDPDPSLTDEPGMGDIGDDLLDTYKDIKAGCVLYECGKPKEALWHWVFLHRVHWGRHAVGALFALHCLSISKRR